MHIIIPARHASTRLPGKPLLEVAGKPLIQRVHEAAQASGVGPIVIATDDARIADAATQFGARVCMTSPAHATGTDRLAETVARLGLPADEIVVNLQGDEPLMPPALIAEIATLLASRPDAAVATACHPIEDRTTWMNPNVVKVVCDRDGYALYFSRAPIPWPRDRAAGEWSGSWGWRHIGLYAYRAGFIGQFAARPVCPLENTEALEQLRVLWYGERIAVYETDAAPEAGVDTPEDLERVRRYFASMSADKRERRGDG